MSKETVVAILTFCAAVATLASKTLPVSTEAQAVLSFAVLVIDAALSAFFSASTLKARQARIAAARIAAPQATKKPTGAG